ncbi:TonB-dependent receptor plug domain-containing protein [Fluviicola sp.]|jgi:outer membrane receptor protein involved in Fe transport|uniref:TonB-dependent receptor n=1 Tax=Fluviicola sp. TaxID=1917219 RepID=UPI002830E67F|nr:TonB-dependent receptor plug domain-containing protein [Fluviicola sp.]MDR0803052.1 TonB-dependent receptor [Fluviicola sp.]
MKSLLFIFCLFIGGAVFSQETVTLSGVVTDSETNEPIIDAVVVCDSTIKAISDINGKYAFQVVKNSKHTITAEYYGFENYKAEVVVGNADYVHNVTLESSDNIIDEVEIVRDVAKLRETPIAFSNITAKQISEDLGTRDLPMILNSTPGVYATEQGGGSGDSRISIRGFDQRNVAVLVDGVPVNDMENGQVYWSNWDGLSDITKTIQVQRGLGASKLAITSVGGTMNIMTKGIDQKFGVHVKQEVNSYGLYKASFGLNTGMMKGNWGISLAGSRKWGSSYADATFDDAWSYFFKVQKKFGKHHLLTFGVNGAPQSHGQRSTKLPVSVVDEKLAKQTGINYTRQLDSVGNTSNLYYTTASIGARGNKYNPNYGMINGDVFNEKVNYFHKPQFNLSHSWNPNDKFNWTTIAYLSVGKGGGTSMKNTPARDTTTGLYEFQKIYDQNSTSISSLYSTTEHSSSNYLRSANNDHKWVGVITSVSYKVNKRISTLFGLDARYYRGSHYQTVYDLMGGDYAIDNSDKNQPKGLGNLGYAMKRVDDKVSYYNDAIVMWGGAFGQVEYKKDKWSTFLTGSLSETGNQRIDYFKKKDLVFADTIMRQAVGYGDTVVYNGRKYTNQSAEARAATTDRKWFLGGTIKGGVNYNITKNHNVFVNVGYLSIAPKMNTVFDNNNMPFLETRNQKVASAELGYGYKSKKFAANVNLYYTLWKNKPPQYTPTVVTPDGTFSYNINGLDALHRGIEVDFNYNLNKKMNFEGVFTLADWKTISGSKVYIIDNNGLMVDSVDFSAKNVHVGDAAQLQIGGSFRYEIIKNLYVKIRYTFFGKNYANFDPLALVGANKDRESWKMPSYGLLDFNFGYTFKVSKLYFTLNGGVMNILDKVYITDSQNGLNFDASSAIVFVGMGRRLNFGLKIGI